MVFLSTPHHGSNLADVLNKLLSVSIIGPTPKQYVGDLSENSPAIEDLNEQFRNFSSKLEIRSFYETLYTKIGPAKLVSISLDHSVSQQKITWRR